MLMKRLIQTLIAAMAMSLCTSAAALGWFSRACPVAEIPDSIKKTALSLFEEIGSAPQGSLVAISSKSIPEQYTYWIHESITADYLSVRYYLYAENNVYRTDYSKMVSASSNFYRFEKRYASAGWLAMGYPKETLTDSKFSIFFANRRFWYSARAGDPNIVVKWDKHWSTIHAIDGRDRFHVTGVHYYFDPAAKRVNYLGRSSASDCNLNNWGLYQDRV